MQVIIGAGEVGRAVFEVLSAKHKCALEDWHYKTATPDVDCLHICFPWYEDEGADNFIGQVKEYKDDIYSGPPVVIHSTVPVGTTAQIPNAVHSPIRGVHPNLAEGVRTFWKYFAGPRDNAAAAIDIFQDCGVDCVFASEDSRTTEAAKLWSTTQYGVSIMVQKAMHAYCEKHGLNFSTIYADFNCTYNSGYEALDMAHVQRPVLQNYPGPIGGHCVIPNAKLLDDDIGAWIIERNELLERGE